MEEDVQEPPGSEINPAAPPPSATRDHQPSPASLIPSRHALHGHSSFIPLSSLGARQISFPLTTTTTTTTATTAREGLTESPSAKRGKYGMAQAWPLQMNPPVVAAAQQPTPSNPVFNHPLALSPSSGPSSASAASFSQSSSPGSAQPSSTAPPPALVMPSSGAQLAMVGAAASPSASHSPSLSRIPSVTATYSQAELVPTHEPSSTADVHLPTRKGKFVSPVWKPLEMLVLARAWRLQYCGSSSKSETVDSTGPSDATMSHKAKTRAEKDWEVAEYLKQHAVQRDVKTAATKWDNMLGDFRRVNEWEKGPERDEVGGKSYFRLSSTERKVHRLPASFDEDVYEEMVQYIGHRPRSLGARSGRGVAAHGGDSTDAAFRGGSREAQYRTSPSKLDSKDATGALVQYAPVGEATTAGGAAVGGKASPGVDAANRGGVAGDLQRIGRIKMVWEESVHIWGQDDGTQQGRLKMENLNFLHADQLVFLDDNFTANAIEAFESGSLHGFSTDTFTSGQHLKVFGRRVAGTSQIVIVPPTGAIPSVLRDRTTYYLSCLKISPTMQLPSLSELQYLLKEPPPRDLRFPVRTDVFMDFPPGRETFFVASSEIDCREIVYEVVAPLIRSMNTGVEKEFLIGLWDDCINRIVKVFCAEEIELIRNNTSSSSCEEERANVCGLVRQLCLWRGEERGLSSSVGSDDPAVRLVNKLLWTYGDLPYILGYYAVGMKVTFCALSRGEHEKLMCTNLVTISLSNPAERLSALTPCWHVAQLLPLLADACARMRNVHSDYSRVHSGSCKIVEVMVSQVRKTYPSRRRWAGVKHMYELLAEQRIPCVERLVKWDELSLSLDFKPRGQPIKPASVDALLQALKCVCTALMPLHSVSLMHRDLRWENVMKRSDIEEEWFLIDFEDAAFEEGSGGAASASSVSSSQQQMHLYYPHRLTPATHAPEMSRGSHGLKVDVWGLGFLIRTCGLDLPEHLKDLQRRFMDPDPDQRPPIDDCFFLLMQVHSSLSHYHHHQ